jgi:hypothetical protein
VHHIIPHGVPTVIRNFAYKQEGCSSWGWATYFYFMPSDKKSFILYADLIHTVRKLPPEKAGQLFITILQYVNEEDFVVDDLLVEIAFEPIKQQLIRDSHKWGERIEQNSINGKKGGRPKKANETEINPNNPPLFLKSEKSLNDNDSVIVSDSVNGNVNAIGNVTKKTKQQNATPLPREEISNPFGVSGTRIWDAWKSYKQDEHRKSYKSAKTEQQAINQLYELSGGNVETASKIVQQSIANQWQGLFELKNTNNGNQKQGGSLRESVQEEFNKRYGVK